MSAPVEIPYVGPPDASEHCKDLVIGILAALGEPNHDDQELLDRMLALVIALSGEIARGGNTETAKARYREVGSTLASLAPECLERARRIREADKSKN